MDGQLSWLEKNFPRFRHFIVPLVTVCVVFIPWFAFASGDGGEAGGHGHAFIAQTFFWLAVLLLLSKLGSLVERVGQPAVLGEIVMGVILGNLVLLNIPWFKDVASNDLLYFLSEFGVVLLLFRIGLESNIAEMKKVGVMAFLVAIIGVILPFALGTWVVGPWLFPDAESVTHLFLGAALTATSVGITARVFQDLRKLSTKEAKVVLGAAVIDDILGLLILAVVSAIATEGHVSGGALAIIIAKAFGFLAAAILIGQYVAKYVGLFLSKIHSGIAMKMAFTIAFALIVAYLAALVGLAPIVGAFAAGLVLDPVHFKAFRSQKSMKEITEALAECGGREKAMCVIEKHKEKHVEDLVDNIGHIFIPLFFIYTGLQVDLSVLFDLNIVLLALAVTAVAFIGKILAGLGCYKGTNKWIVGFGMIPRGEVGLIFANVGKQLGVVDDKLFAIVVVMVIVTTLATPPVLTFLLKRQKEAA